jgi:hypothetical protein
MLRSERSGSASAQEGGERRRDKPGGQPVIKAVPTFVLAGTLQVHGGIACGRQKLHDSSPMCNIHKEGRLREERVF